MKVIILKKKVNELYQLINKLRNLKDQTSTINNNYNNIDLYHIPSTPSQAKKISIMNQDNYKNINMMIKNDSKSNFLNKIGGNNENFK